MKKLVYILFLFCSLSFGQSSIFLLAEEQAEPTAIYTAGDAADPNNEGNNTTGWSVDNGPLTISTDGDAQDGSYAIRIDHDGPDNTAAKAIHDLSSYLQPNTRYTYTFYLKRGVGSTGNWEIDAGAGLTLISNTAGFITSAAGNSYIQYTMVFDTGSSSPYEIDYRFNSNADNADIMLIDNVVLTETP